jgi:hypothetical protein
MTKFNLNSPPPGISVTEEKTWKPNLRAEIIFVDVLFVSIEWNQKA